MIISRIVSELKVVGLSVIYFRK